MQLLRSIRTNKRRVHEGGRERPERPARRWRRALRKATHRQGCSGSALMLGAQQRECVLDALVEDVVGELPVGQGAGKLERPDHQSEDG